MVDFSLGEPPTHPSWAEIAAATHQQPGLPTPVDGATLSKLKSSVTDTVHIDADIRLRAHRRFQFALYGKLFGKSSPFEVAKAFLMGLWKVYGMTHISNMPNGFHIRCETEEAKQ